MSSSFANPPVPANRMRGPDFALGTVRSWTESPGHAGVLLLDDGSRWQLAPDRADHDVQKAFVERALARGTPLLVSGDRARGVVDRLATGRLLAAQRVEAAGHGRFSVLFAGPPSIYYLRMDRPLAAQSLALLQQSAARALLPDQPDLVVGIDTVASEVILVQARPVPAR